MACEYCLRIDGHVCGCPNYEPPKTHMYCESCGEGIYDSEEYIENDDGEYAHYDCLSGRDLVKFFGYEVKTKGENE